MENIILKTSGFTKEEIQQVARIHINEMDTGFLSSLGDRPTELVYSHASQSKLCILILAINPETNNVCGFVLGTLDTSSLYKQFLRQKLFQSFICIAPKLISAYKIRGALESLAYPKKTQFLNTPKAELLAVAVTKEHRGTGLARQLWGKLIESFKEKGITEFKITTGDDLIPAHKFYEKMGAKRSVLVEIHKEHRAWIYIYKI